MSKIIILAGGSGTAMARLVVQQSKQFLNLFSNKSMV